MESLQALSKNRRTKIIRPPAGIPPEEEISEHGKAVSEAEYREKYYNHPVFSYEWNNGYLEEKTGTDHGGFLMYRWLLGILDPFLTVNPGAQITGLDIGFRLDFPGGNSIRKPDMGVIRKDNPVQIGLTDFSYSGTFDLCTEIISNLSPKEIRRDTVHKKREYRGSGVKEYYILDPRGYETAFYRLDESGIYRDIIPENGDIIRSRVLPGFQFRINDLYRQPAMTELAGDSVYKSYVMREYQAEKRKAELEKQKVGKLAEKLKALGISTEEIEKFCNPA